jgi:hypothetical protein
MAYNRYNRRSSTVFHAAGNAVAPVPTGFDPKVKPDPALVAEWTPKRPHYQPLATVPANWDYIVLDVPFGKRGSGEVRQWAKTIGARWNSTQKEWRIVASLVCSDRLAIINQLCLYKYGYARPAPIYLARFGQDNCIVILQVPFEEKDTAKSAGARWDTILRKWYFPMKGQIGVVAFSQKIAEFEEKGWVDTVATETFNARFLGCKNADLDRLRIAHRTAAGAGAFVNKIGPWTSAPVAAQAQYTVKTDEAAWLSAVLEIPVPDAADEIANEWILIRPVNAPLLAKYIRIQRCDGVHAYRVSLWNNDSTAVPMWNHAFFPPEEARLIWVDAVEHGGYTLHTHKKDTAGQFLHQLAFENWVEHPSTVSLGLAREKIQKRIRGAIDCLGGKG